MIVGIVGLGLIGGSVAKAIKHSTPHTVLGRDILEPVLRKAILLDAVDDSLTDEKLSICDIIIIATYPGISIDFVKNNYTKFKKDVIVMDCCGVKQVVCDALFPLAKENGFTFIGAHPMAGLEYSGFDNAQRKLFNNASIILVPPQNTDLELLHKIKQLWSELGFTNFEITTPEKHDRIIAYTSQLAHVVSSAYIKSPTAKEHAGFSAGSYKDMTRVARLNETMWTELFLENAENLEKEVDTVIENLTKYRDAIKAKDEATLKELLKEGRICKENADKGEDRL
ncbi:MAG: prephenate dehydrogenase [Spirochaetaceae bacterium]|nr:prephenate dehydrogenase [Spirochaetaceae bacterium]